MHIYIYDEFVNSAKNEKILVGIEKRITDLGLNGKTIKLGAMKNNPNLVENEIKNGAKTLVAVGDDRTLAKIANLIIKNYYKNDIHDVVLGYIPVCKTNSQIAEALGVNIGESACDVLSARRVAAIHAGQVVPVSGNKQSEAKYFISNAFILSESALLELDEKYFVETKSPCAINFINMPTIQVLPKGASSGPLDKKIEIMINSGAKKSFFKRDKGEQSFFSAYSISIDNCQGKIVLDDNIEAKLPAQIKTTGKILNLIVGKERKF